MLSKVQNDPFANKMLEELWHEELQEHRRTTEATAHSAATSFVDLMSILEMSVRRGGKILLFGNGGQCVGRPAYNRRVGGSLQDRSPTHCGLWR